jgi:hypothetical protein
VLVDFLKPHLAELYLTLHHEKNVQLHPRLRGWSRKPEMLKRARYGEDGWNHPDWNLNRESGLFEAYIGKSGEYWTRDEGKDPPLAERIKRDYKTLFERLLRSCKPEVFPDTCSFTDIEWRLKNKEYLDVKLFDTVDTLIFKIK